MRIARKKIYIEKIVNMRDQLMEIHKSSRLQSNCYEFSQKAVCYCSISLLLFQFINLFSVKCCNLYMYNKNTCCCIYSCFAAIYIFRTQTHTQINTNTLIIVIYVLNVQFFFNFSFFCICLFI